MSSISSLSIALKGLLASQIAIDTIAHNITNASTDGYSRQTAELRASMPAPTAGSLLLIGTGVDVLQIRRTRDQFLDLQFRAENQRGGRADELLNALDVIQSMVDDPGANGINAGMTGFFNAIRDIASAPEDPATRTALAEIADNLTFIIRRTYSQLKNLQSNLDSKVGLLVGEINSITQQIVDLSAQILRAQGGGAAPNDLLDRRDLLVDSLSRIAPITTSIASTESGVINISIAGVGLVSGIQRTVLATQINSTTGFDEVVAAGDTTVLSFSGGRLSGLLTARDTEVASVISDLNSLSEALIRETNRVQRGGFGLEQSGVGNITAVTSTLGTTGVYTVTDDGAGNLSVTYTPDSGSAGTAVTGTISAGGANSTLIPGITLTAGSSLTAGVQTITVSDGLALAGTGSLAAVSSANGVYKLTTNAAASTVSITFTPTGGSESSAIVKSLTPGSAQSNLIAGLTITTASTLTDGVDYLTTGNNFFTQTTAGQDAAGSIKVLDAIKQNASLIAASSGYGEPGNTGNVISLGQLQDLGIASLSQSTMQQFYQGRIAALGARGQQQRATAENQGSLLNHLQSARSSVSGVSLDEETANLIRFQRSFQASARVLTTVDELLDQVINRMGLVGR